MTKTTFQELKLIKPIHRALADENYTTPTDIQAQAIPHLLGGRDLLGCAQTGTGKTAAFALPILNRIATQTQAARPAAPRVLVLSPTRELAAQISDSFATYGRHLKFRQTVVFGGVGQARQVRDLKHGVHVLVATPGRLLDLMNQGYVRLDQLEVFVLDEADRMLDMGFLPDLRRIISKLPANRQSLFFSATLPDKVVELARTLLNDPVRVDVSPQATTVEQIEQRVMHVAGSNKKALLERVLQEPGVGQVLVFTRTKRGADVVSKQLLRNGVKADAIHGNKSQNARTRTLNLFRNGRTQVLVATDVAARGIDVDGITHVINFDLPIEPECYVHRIGRTARAGAAGIAVSFCDPSERGQLRAIERLIRTSIDVHSDHPFHAQAAPQPRSQGRRPFKRSQPPRPQAGAGRKRRRNRQTA